MLGDWQGFSGLRHPTTRQTPCVVLLQTEEERAAKRAKLAVPVAAMAAQRAQQQQEQQQPLAEADELDALY
mgnify:CR=1 FL=1